MSVDITKRFLPPRPATVGTPVAGNMNGDTLAAATKIMVDVWKNEEARFNNLNTRAIALISAASLVATFIGFLSKNLIDPKDARLTGGLRDATIAGTGFALVLLLLAMAVIILGVLRPGPRLVWGNNDVTRGTASSSHDVDKVNFEELGAVYFALVNRTRQKAYWLTLGYMLFGSAVTAAVATAFSALAGWPSPGV